MLSDVLYVINKSYPQNGETRSLCVALECFSSLFPFTRPSKCSVYAQSLIPVLLRLISREEESLHDALQDAFRKILPKLTPFMSLTNIKVSSDCLLNLPGVASYSFMVALIKFLVCTVYTVCNNNFNMG